MIYLVVEIFDGNVGIIPCADILTAREIKDNFVEASKNNGEKYTILTNKKDYYSAEIDSCTYSVEIRGESLKNYHDDEVALIRWCEDDLREALENRGFKSSEKNIEILCNNRLERTLEDRSIEAGWDVIDTIIINCEDKLEQ